MAGSLYIIAGQDFYLRTNALRDIKNKVLPPKSSDADYTLLYASECPLADILDAIMATGFLSSQKLILVKDAGLLEAEAKEKIIRSALKAEKTHVILESHDRKALLNNITDKLQQKIKVYDCAHPGAGRTKRLLLEYFKKQNKKISPEALELLLFNLGGDLAALFDAAERVCLHAGNNQQITLDDIQRQTVSFVEYSVFKLTDAILAKDAKKSFTVLKTFNLDKGEAIKVFATIVSQFERIYKAKKMAEEGVNFKQIVSALRVPFFLQDALRQQIRAYRASDLEAIFERIMETDEALKRSRLEPASALEGFILKVC